MTRKACKSNLTDEEWGIIEPLIPPAKPGGHLRTVDMREVINTIFYLLRTGCSWEMLTFFCHSGESIIKIKLSTQDTSYG